MITNQLLQQVVFHLQNPAISTNTTRPTSTLDSITPFSPSSAILWVNGLWFVSLTFSLTGAFGTILAKGWVSQFIPVSAGLPLDDACNRHRRFFGDDQRHLQTVITTLPITLHVGFYLFFGGLVILLFGDDVRIGLVVMVFIAITMLLYFGFSIHPMLNSNSPFRMPISSILPVVSTFIFNHLPYLIMLDSRYFTPSCSYMWQCRPPLVLASQSSPQIVTSHSDFDLYQVRAALSLLYQRLAGLDMQYR